MVVWLVRNVFGEPLFVFSTRKKALDFVNASIQSAVVTRFTPSTAIFRMEVDVELLPIAA